MQFSTGYICILAAFMNISLLQTVAADAEVMSSLGGAKGKTATAGGGAGGMMATLQTSLISAIDGFLKEPVPPNASGTVFTVALLYLEKTAGGAGGAAPGGAAGGAAAGGKGKKAKRSQ
ncbi:hypothetical protein Pst134EB_006091 [Puccinia striiformis f. sp. tritici]|uniref:Uncharacterized protein n=1 Tax=Puccinia striiformis f. sp. tritici PST-78 TaxID=1165861 RepID=A0A0L0V5P7_9BASI|nr:hypothetical protein Pst134EB_006091 [Puccinia striiformis f. sp. tritici]KNE94339.1 hypothetical protein PSTG_12364 [Puccinia striiformis f. sp. tritici PST-78]